MWAEVRARLQAWLHGLVAAGLALVLAACVATPSLDESNEFFVDNARPQDGDGRSWQTAWSSFAAIDWAAIRPGDTLTISGGEAGRVYLETLIVGTSGEAGRPVTIRTAADPGHAGPVVIDAEDRRANGVVLEARDHVTVRGLAIRNVDDAGVKVRAARGGVLIEQVSVSAGNPNGRGNARGFDVRDSRGVVLRRNAYTTPAYSPAQNDGIFSMHNDDVHFIDNQFIMLNNYQGADEGHNDCIQSYMDRNIWVIGNYCEQRNRKTGHSLGIFVQNISGTAVVVDNVVMSPQTRSACIAVENLPDFPTAGRMLAYHNTAYGCAYGTLHIVRSPDSEAMNNILVAPGRGAQSIKIVPPAPPPRKIDHNLHFTANSAFPAFIGGRGPLAWNAWRKRGYDSASFFGDPNFRDLGARDFRLRAGSPGIGRAAALPNELAALAGGPWGLRPDEALGASIRHDPPSSDASALAWPTL